MTSRRRFRMSARAATACDSRDLCRFLSGFVIDERSRITAPASAGCKCRFGANVDSIRSIHDCRFGPSSCTTASGSVLRLAFDPDRLVAMPSQSLSSAI